MSVICGSTAPAYSFSRGTGTCNVQATGMPGFARYGPVASNLDLCRRLEAACAALARVADSRLRGARAGNRRRGAHIAPPVHRPRPVRRTAHLRYRARPEPSNRVPQQRSARSAAWLLPPARIHASAPDARLSNRGAGTDVRGDGAARRSRYRAPVSRKSERRSRGSRCKRGGDVRRAARKAALRALRRCAIARRRQPPVHRRPRAAGNRKPAAQSCVRLGASLEGLAAVHRPKRRPAAPDRRRQHTRHTDREAAPLARRAHAHAAR